MKVIVLLVDTSDHEKTDKITQWMRSQSSLGWWHWTVGAWIITADEDSVRAQDIRDALGGMGITNNTMVLEFDDYPSNWSGRGPAGDDKNMFDWIRRNLGG